MSPLRAVSLLATLSLLVACSSGDRPGSSPAAPSPTAASSSSGSPSSSVASTTDAGTSTTSVVETGPTFELIAEFDADAEGMPTGSTWAVLSPDGSKMFVGTSSGAAVFDTSSGTVAWALDTEIGVVRSAAFDTSGRRLATGHQDGGARVWDTASGALLAERLAPAAYPPVDVVTMSSDGDTVASSGWVQGTTTVWDVATGAELLTVDGGGPVFSPDESLLATVSVGRSVTLWDAATGSRLHELDAIAAMYVENVLFSPDSSLLALSGSIDEYGPFTAVWDTAAGTELARVSSTSLFAAPRWSEDGTELLVRLQDDHTLVVVDPRTGERIADGIAIPLSEGAFVDAAFVRGDLVATASATGAVALWSTDGEEVAELATTDPDIWVFRMIVSADGTTVATLSDDGQARVWHERTAAPLTPSVPPGSTSIPSAPASPPPVLDADALLRGDGLGQWRFGDAATAVEADLTELLGPPNAWETVRGARLAAARYPAERELRIVSWPWGLDVAFSDLQLVAWRYAPFGYGMSGGLPPEDWPLLRTPAGITGGTPLADLRAWYGGDLAVDTDGPCAGPGPFPWETVDPFAPARYDDDGTFTVLTTGLAETGLRGQADANLPAYVGRLEAGVLARCADEETAPASPSTTTTLARPVLRGDGLDGARFGDPLASVLVDLERLLGPPDLDAFRANVGEHTTIPTLGIDWGTTGRITQWHEAGLTVVWSDTLEGLDLPTPRTGDLRFAAWVAGPRLRTDTGGGVGATVELLAGSVPELRVGQRFETPMGALTELRAFVGTDGLRGILEEWDVVTAVENRLVELGYDLDADGRWMQPTTVALRAAALELGLDPDLATNPPALELVEALGIGPPDSTLVVELASGANASPGWWLD